MKFIPISKPSITNVEIDYVTDAVKSTWVSSLGKYIDRFEKEFAEFCGTKYAVSVSNGTVAIQLALHALGIKNGDEVIVPDLSFIATANAVLHTGAKPVFVDIDTHNLCISPIAIKAAITSKTKAIIAVHLYGHPANMVEINKLAEEFNLVVIEDAAEAHGATINGKKVGGWGRCATFSFYGNKNLTTGEGGMITTDDKDLYDKCRYLRDHAMSKEKRYWHTEIGFNFRLTNLQAALGCAQMSRIEEMMGKRNKIYEWYNKYLKKVTNISLNRTYEWATNCYWLICIEIKGITEYERDKFMVDLRQYGIDSRPYFYPMSDMPYFEKAHTPNAHMASQSGLSLPTFIDISESDIEYICDKVNRCLESSKLELKLR